MCPDTTGTTHPVPLWPAESGLWEWIQAALQGVWCRAIVDYRLLAVRMGKPQQVQLAAIKKDGWSFYFVLRVSCKVSFAMGGSRKSQQKNISLTRQPPADFPRAPRSAALQLLRLRFARRQRYC